MKDVGGLVADYRAMTDRYRAEDREVRLHECRSACTLALSLPGVCVYPTSILKFHQAYDLNTKVADQGVSQELFDSYPAAVQVKLGTLTRGYKVLTGAELIALGIRNCNEGRTVIARSRPAAPQTQVADAAPQGIGGVLQSMLTAVAHPFGDMQAVAAPARPAPATVLPPPEVPVPPRRPTQIASASVQLAAYQPEPTESAANAGSLPAPGLPTLIGGAQPAIPSGSFSLPPWAP